MRRCYDDFVPDDFPEQSGWSESAVEDICKRGVFDSKGNPRLPLDFRIPVGEGPFSLLFNLVEEYLEAGIIEVQTDFFLLG